MHQSAVILTSRCISCPGWILAELRHYTVQYATKHLHYVCCTIKPVLIANGFPFVVTYKKNKHFNTVN